MRLRILVLVALRTVVLTPAAGAATVTGSTVDVLPAGSREPVGYPTPAVRIAADAGDDDDLEVFAEGATVTVRSRVLPLRATGTCVSTDTTTVVCPSQVPGEYVQAVLPKVDLGDGDDRLVAHGVVPAVSRGGPGEDTIDLRDGRRGPLPVRGNPDADGGPGDDVLLGSPSGDTLLGRAGDDQLIGGAGLDRLFPSTGDDVVDGGVDTDGVRYTQRAPVDVDLRTGRATGAGDDRLEAVEAVDVRRGDVTGTVGDDADLRSDDGSVRGLTGDDTLFVRGRGAGGPGNDVVFGSGRLTGGPGDDDVGGGTYRDPDDQRPPTRVTGGPGDDAIELFGTLLGAASCGSGRDALAVPRRRVDIPADCERVEIASTLVVDRWRTTGDRLRLRIGTPGTSLRCRPAIEAGGARRGRVRLSDRPRRLSYALDGRPATFALRDDGDCTSDPGPRIELRFPG